MKKNIVLPQLIIACGLVLLTGCTPHLNKQQCESINWYQMGSSDGSLGKQQRDLTQDETDCAKFHIQIDRRQYVKGWKSGVVSFCQPQNGYNLGEQGKTFNAICPANLSRSFSSAYKRGLKKYCVPPSGYTMGRNGADYPQACSPGAFPAFANAFNEGKSRYNQIANLQSQLNSINSQIDNQNKQIKNNNDTISNAYKSISQARDAIAVSKNHRKRKLLKANLRNQYDQIVRLNEQNRQLQAHVSNITQEQKSLQQQIAVMQSDN